MLDEISEIKKAGVKRGNFYNCPNPMLTFDSDKDMLCNEVTRKFVGEGKMTIFSKNPQISYK